MTSIIINGKPFEWDLLSPVTYETICHVAELDTTSILSITVAYPDTYPDCSLTPGQGAPYHSGMVINALNTGNA